VPSLARQQAQEYFKELLKRKRQEMSPAVRRRNKDVLRGSTWLYPWGVEREYSAYVKRIMNRFSELAMPTVRENLQRWLEETSLFDSDTEVMDAYNAEFAALISSLRALQNEIFVENEDEVKADIFGFGAEVNAFNREQWSNITTLAIGTSFDVDTGWTQGVLQNWTELNYQLIESLSDEYIKKLNTIVAEGVQQGSRYTDIMADLRKMDNNMTGYRAELIARDQIGKLNGSLTEGRMVDAGVSGYVWLTALDERVRPTHQQMSGSQNKWQDRSVYKPRGEKDFRKRPSSMSGAIPGSQIQCRCTALPAFDDIVADVDELIESEERNNPERTQTRRGPRRPTF
jgi:SPP1 gp7 family putative phage head morphogenesis protein